MKEANTHLHICPFWFNFKELFWLLGWNIFCAQTCCCARKVPHITSGIAPMCKFTAGLNYLGYEKFKLGPIKNIETYNYTKLGPIKKNWVPSRFP